MEEVDDNDTPWLGLIPLMEHARGTGSNRAARMALAAEYILRMLHNGLFQDSRDRSRGNIARRVRFAHFAALLARHHRLATESRFVQDHLRGILEEIGNVGIALQRFRPHAMGIYPEQRERDLDVFEAVTENVLGRLNHDQISQMPGSGPDATNEERTDYQMASVTARIFGVLRNLLPILRRSTRGSFNFPDSVRIRIAWLSLHTLWPYHDDRLGGENFRNYGNDQRAAYDLFHFVLRHLVYPVPEDDTSEWEPDRLDWNGP